MTTSPTPVTQHRGLRRVLTSLATVLAAGVAFVGLPAASASAVSIPIAPSNLSYGYANGAAASLVWADNSTDETAFEIERCIRPTSTTCGSYALVATTLANQTAWIDSAWGPYQYRVRAINAAGASGYTAEVHAPNNGAPSAVIAPVAPATATLPVTFDGSLSAGLDFGTVVTWEWSYGDGATSLGTITTHTYAFAGTYTVTLTVTDQRGSTGYARTLVTVAPLPLVGPSNLTATSTVKRRVDLTWTAPVTPGATVTILRCTGPTCSVFGWLANPSSTATSFSDFSVRSGTTYRYVVVAGYPSGSTQTAYVTVKAR
ncbi:MAG: PKD domain-containing protein [Propionibacteriaceae bacterium]